MTTSVIEKSDAESLDTLDPSEPHRFANGSAHAMFERLRRDAPVHYCTNGRFGPFWSISLHEDITEIEALPAIYSSEARHGGVSVIDIKRQRRAI